MALLLVRAEDANWTNLVIQDACIFSVMHAGCVARSNQLGVAQHRTRIRKTPFSGVQWINFFEAAAARIIGDNWAEALGIKRTARSICARWTCKTPAPPHSATVHAAAQRERDNNASRLVCIYLCAYIWPSALFSCFACILVMEFLIRTAECAPASVVGIYLICQAKSATH